MKAIKVVLFAVIFALLMGASVLAQSIPTFHALASFDESNGAFPWASLMQATDGNFYGTTQNGGSGSACDSGCGTIFKLTPGGALSTLYSFNYTDGAYPFAGLVQGANGSLYGVTLGGGTGTGCPDGACGTVFGITLEGELTTLYSFYYSTGAGSAGAGPQATLALGTDGNFYGSTSFGGRITLVRSLRLHHQAY